MILLIHDLQQNLELDTQAMAAVRGGFTAMTNSMVTTMGPAPGLKRHHPSRIPSSFFKQSLENISEQLNIAVGSANVIQGNSNSVIQY